ncbi:MAG TPA: glycoside hydrolase family 16 protein [Solirubrobacteraceae bacterium]|nr:glycoside hydrolase family 16 protein [Solirubrobacteraceae bacterium]
MPNPAALPQTVGRIDRVIVGSYGRVVALLGILATTLALVAPVEAGSNGRGYRARHAAPVVGGSARWRHLVWSDNFKGPVGARPNPRRWSFDIGGNGWGNEELESYTSKPSNAELDGQGHLVITARAETYTGPDGAVRSYTSARLQTLHTFQFKYGLVEARIKVPAGQGLLPQFWMLGDNAYQPNGWPGSGEIDTMEVLGSHPYVVKGTIHGPWSWAPHGVSANLRSPISLASGFHVYGVEWEPNRISFLLDGSVYQTIAPVDLPAGAAWPFRHPYFLLLDLAVGGVWAGSPSPTTPLPAQMIVDWVRVWQ